MTPDPETVRATLRLGGDTNGWLADLAALGPPAEPVRVPSGDDAYTLLRRLEVPGRDAEEIAAATPGAQSHPELWWLLERVHHRLVRDLGDFTTMDQAPSLPYELGPAARYFYVYVFLAGVPVVRRYHQDRRVPEDIAWTTLAQLGEMVEIHRRQYGVGGMDKQFWLALHLRGVLYRLGRLQFNLQLAGERAGPLAADLPVLGTHIPETGGPMGAAGCDASFRQARPFYDRYFPEHGARVAVCTSWLLDPQLADYLPESSNIVRFLRRWTLVDEEPRPGGDSVLEFVFRRNGQPLDELPRTTMLQRAVLARLEAGRHWHQRTGWLELP